ncbi:hypothetical protein MKW98_026968, partial [Papaver atlanticum]
IKILKAMEFPKLSSSALKLLIGIEYFPVHIDLDLLKLNVRTKYSDDIISAAEDLLSNFDPDKGLKSSFRYVGSDKNTSVGSQVSNCTLQAAISCVENIFGMIRDLPNKEIGPLLGLCIQVVNR